MPGDSVFASLAEWQLLAIGAGFICSGFVCSGLGFGAAGVNLQWQFSAITLPLVRLGHILGLKGAQQAGRSTTASFVTA